MLRMCRLPSHLAWLEHPLGMKYFIEHPVRLLQVESIYSHPKDAGSSFKLVFIHYVCLNNKFIFRLDDVDILRIWFRLKEMLLMHVNINMIAFVAIESWVRVFDFIQVYMFAAILKYILLLSEPFYLRQFDIDLELIIFKPQINS